MNILNGVDLPVHPTTGLQALGMGQRGPIWPVMGGSQPTGEGQQQSDGGQQQAGGQGGGGQQAGQQNGQQQGSGGQQQSGAGTSGTGSSGSSTSQGHQGSGQQHSNAGQGGSQQGGERDLGFPPDTPVAEMTDKQAAAYWKHQSRKHESRNQEAQRQIAELKPRADQYDQLAQASRTEHEKAIDEAKAQARAEAEREAALAQVRARFEYEAKGRIVNDKGETDEEKLTAILDPIDMSKFLTADGKVDTARVKTFVDGIAPKQGGTKSPDMGQGRRDAGTTSGVQSGRDLYRQRHPAKANASART